MRDAPYVSSTLWATIPIIACLGVLFLHGIAHSRTVVVSQDGTGDTQTIQAAVDLVIAYPVDTVLVRAGYYPETVLIPEHEMHEIKIVCPAGPSQTGVSGLEFVPSEYVRWSFEGLRVSNHVRVESNIGSAEWQNCRFENGFTAINRWHGAPDLTACEFNGRVRLSGVGDSGGPGVVDCRFVRATLHVDNLGAGRLTVRRCEFVGPVDTAVVADPSENSRIQFIDCVFRNTQYAIVAKPELHFYLDGVFVQRCSFFNIAGAALSYHFDGALPPYQWSALSLWVLNSRFEHCGSALRWESPAAQSATLEADTILASTGDAVRVTSYRDATIQNVHIEGSGGRGLVVRSSEILRDGPRQVTIRDCDLVNNGGAGLILEDPHGTLGSLQVSGNRAEGNGRDGIRVESAALEPPTSAQRAITSNTLVLNGGRGLRVAGSGTYFADVERNLVVGNELAGLSVSGIPESSARWNDAWLNGGGGYEGGVSLTDNLQLDPRFCNIYIGDYQVQESSPCAPSGPYGQIGAFGVGCTSSHVELMALRGNGEHPPNAAGQLKVGLLGHRLFDPSSVDAASMTLGGAAPSENGGNQKGMKLRDVNQDGVVDGILAFRGNELAMTLAGEAVFAGTTQDGVALSGVIEVRELKRGEQPLLAGQDFRFAIPRITPNPSNGRFLIEFTSPGGSPVELSLYDVAGRRVRSAALDEAAGVRRIEVSGLTPGVYFGVMKVGSESVRRRVVVR